MQQVQLLLGSKVSAPWRWHSKLVSVEGPTCIHPTGLLHCHSAGVGVESWGVVWQIRRKVLLVGTVAEGAVRAGAAAAPVPMIGLETGGSKKDRKVEQRVKEELVRRNFCNNVFPGSIVHVVPT